MDKRTLSPWKIGDGHAFGSLNIYGPRRAHVAEVWNGGTRKPAVAKANAEAIVRAVNHHDALVAMLERMIDYEDGSSPPDTFGGELFAEAAVLLAKVKS